MEKHTPGPWAVRYDYQITAHMKETQKQEPIAQAFSGSNKPAELIANARLIAAAPELLAAIENAANVLAGIACGDLKTIRPDSAALKQARAAIAKAKGE